MDKNIEIVVVDEQFLREKIYFIRGQQVMLDVDLAKIYGYTTRTFNQQVRRNIDRFPDDFMFRLTKEEVYQHLRSQNVILDVGKYSKYLPYAFTESGIYMLMTVLKGELAIEQSKTLIRLFKRMKDFLQDNQFVINQKNYLSLVERIEEHQRDIKEIRQNMVNRTELSEFIKLFDNARKSEEILILNGEPFKADIAYQNIYRNAKKSIIVVDDYIGVKTLQHLAQSKTNVTLTIISDNKGRSLRLSEYTDFQTEYQGRSVNFLQSAGMVHDRYIVLDHDQEDMKVYLCGSSSKDSGKRITTIIQINDITEFKAALQKLLTNQPLIIN